MEHWLEGREKIESNRFPRREKGEETKARDSLCV